MHKKILIPLAGVLALALIVFLTGCAQAVQGSDSTNPQQLLIPNWFLSELTIDGQKVDIPAGQQKITIQFTQDGQANGSGGCNSFGASYQASKDGKMKIDQIISTMMACQQGMQQEQDYFKALAKVQQFQVADGKLTMSSTDGKTVLVFIMPPK